MHFYTLQGIFIKKANPLELIDHHPQPDINANYAEEKSAEADVKLEEEEIVDMKPILEIAQKFEPSFHIPNYDRPKKKMPAPKEPPAEPQKFQSSPPEFVKVAAQLKRVPEILRRPSARISGRPDVSAAKVTGFQELPVNNIPRYNGLLLDIAPNRPQKAQAPAPPAETNPTVFEPVSTKIAAWDSNAAKRPPPLPTAPTPASISIEPPKKVLIQSSDVLPKKVEPPAVPATPPPVPVPIPATVSVQSLQKPVPAKTVVNVAPPAPLDTFVTAKICQIKTTLDNMPPSFTKTTNGHLPSSTTVSTSSGSDSEEAPSTVTTTDGGGPTERPPRVFSPPPRSSNDPPSPAKFRALLQSFESASGGASGDLNGTSGASDGAEKVPPPPYVTTRVVPRRSVDISPSSASTSSEDIPNNHITSNPIMALRESSTTVASYGRDMQIADAPIPPPDYDMKDDWSFKNGHSTDKNGEISRDEIVNGHLEDEIDEDEVK